VRPAPPPPRPSPPRARAPARAAATLSAPAPITAPRRARRYDTDGAGNLSYTEFAEAIFGEKAPSDGLGGGTSLALGGGGGGASASSPGGSGGGIAPSAPATSIIGTSTPARPTTAERHAQGNFARVRSIANPQEAPGTFGKSSGIFG
jgi:hypothetical protein